MLFARLLLIPVLTLLPCVASAYALPHGDTAARYVAVEIKNGPVLYGELIRRDAESISIRRLDDSCAIKIDLREVERVFDVKDAGVGADQSLNAKRAARLSREAWLSLGARGSR